MLLRARPLGGDAVLVGVYDDEGELVRVLDRGRHRGEEQREHREVEGLDELLLGLLTDRREDGA